MKKSLIALAVVGAFTAQAAMADVTVYGAANVSFDMVNNGNVTNSTSTNHIASNVSKLGFKGSEDLGDGLSAVFQIEQAITMDSGALNTATARNTFAGLSSASMGTVVLGFHDTPYKIATRGLDLFADTVADNRSIMGLNGAHDTRLQVGAYISPEMSGFKVLAAIAAGAEVPVANATKGNAFSLAALYNAGPINAAFGYQVIDVGTAGTGVAGAGTNTAGSLNLTGLAVNDKLKAWKLGGSYTMDAIQVNAVYEKTSSSGLVLLNAHDRTAFYLGGKFNINANDAVKAAYTSAGKLNNVINTESTQFSLGYDHNLSKRTTVYALYSKISNKTAATATFSQATSAAGANGIADADPSVWSLGMKHAF